MRLFRENLHYTVLFKETEEEKYNALRSLIAQKNCPTIVYVSRTRRTIQLAEKLTSDGFPAKPFNGKMDSNEKITNQEAFINNQVKIIVATSAFGMGVDKKDVKLVIHYDISDSLENYVQEAGRAGRDPSLLAECYVLFNDDDLDKHFMLLNQTKLSISEIQQVWKALKDMTREKPWVCCSALEIARYAGWDASVNEIETRVKTAVAALENAGYVKRGMNVPHVYATSILVKDMAEASFKIERSPVFNGKQKENAKRIIKSLISSRSIADAGNDDAESRVDYLADILGIPKEDVVTSINLMRQEGLLADSIDMSAYILKTDTENRSAQILNRFAKLEEFLLNRIAEQGADYSLKELNEAALAEGVMTLIGNAANFVEIKTFHSYCFDLLGKIGSLDGVENVVHDAAQMIANGEVEQGKITKSVLVIDEAQDMDANEFALIRALMQNNDDMRVIAVGDDDQNIYEFRGSDSAHMQSLIDEYGATQYELVENYRSKANIVALANRFAESISHRMKQHPIEAVQNENGTVQIIRHTSDNMEEAIVRQIIEQYHGGKVCVLTGTNEEALRVMGLLLKNGVRAKLIQSLDGFRLYNLAEVRFFLRCIDRDLKTPVIGNDLWNKAKEELARVYSDSICLENLANMISEFEKVNTYSKYRTDLEEFIKESQFEDFYTDDRETVFVSTIHKSKGREFDSVWLLLNHTVLRDDAERRKLYVGMTRAKDNLYIHCNNGIFDTYQISGVDQFVDEEQYPEPQEITLQLTHKDVVLDFFKGKKEIIFKLHSGMPLSIKDEFLYAELDGRTVKVAKLSKARMLELENLSAKGYRPCGGEVRFVVAWKGESDIEETAVLLPNLHFKKD